MDDFTRFYQHLQHQQIKIFREPIAQPNGTIAVFGNIYGNLWNLIEPPVHPTGQVSDDTVLTRTALNGVLEDEVINSISNLIHNFTIYFRTTYAKHSFV